MPAWKKEWEQAVLTFSGRDRQLHFSKPVVTDEEAFRFVTNHTATYLNILNTERSCQGFKGATGVLKHSNTYVKMLTLRTRPRDSRWWSFTISLRKLFSTDNEQSLFSSTKFLLIELLLQQLWSVWRLYSRKAYQNAHNRMQGLEDFALTFTVLGHIYSHKFTTSPSRVSISQ